MLPRRLARALQTLPPQASAALSPSSYSATVAAPSPWSRRFGSSSSARTRGFAGLIAAATATATAASAFQEEAPPPTQSLPGDRNASLPTYSLQEVQEHTGAKKNGIWVVYRHGVYDITQFILSHPGGTKILLAAGKSIEPFWQLYAAHNHDDVHKILEGLRIGNLKEEDVATLEKLRKERYGDGPYSRDPTRHPALKINSSMPFNAEPPPELLMESFITPNELFFVRNHLPVPDVNVDEYTLKIEGLGLKNGADSCILWLLNFN
jgi:sulfite oxidase